MHSSAMSNGALYLVDAPASADPLGDFKMLNQELARYKSGQLANVPQAVVMNRVDAFESDEYSEGEETMMQLSRDELKDGLVDTMQHSRLMWMSAKEKEGVEDLMGRMAKCHEREIIEGRRGGIDLSARQLANYTN
eukprot:217283_1